jgi:hypothetical protein
MTAFVGPMPKQTFKDYEQEKTYQSEISIKRELVQDRIVKLCNLHYFSKNRVTLVKVPTGYNIIDNVTLKLVTSLDIKFINNLLKKQIVFFDDKKTETIV